MSAELGMEADPAVDDWAAVNLSRIAEALIDKDSQVYAKSVTNEITCGIVVAREVEIAGRIGLRRVSATLRIEMGGL